MLEICLKIPQTVNENFILLYKEINHVIEYERTFKMSLPNLNNSHISSTMTSKSILNQKLNLNFEVSFEIHEELIEEAIKRNNNLIEYLNKILSERPNSIIAKFLQKIYENCDLARDLNNFMNQLKFSKENKKQLVVLNS